MIVLVWSAGLRSGRKMTKNNEGEMRRKHPGISLSLWSHTLAPSYTSYLVLFHHKCFQQRNSSILLLIK